MFFIAKKELQINEEIVDEKIRVIDADGSQLGIFTPSDALKKAERRNLDLVKIAPKADPPVCRIMDYGKYRFEQSKKDKAARKHQKIAETKELRMSINIDVHDFNTKLKSAIKFLKSGDKVKASVRFRGREMAYTDLGNDLLRKFLAGCEEMGTPLSAPKMEGRNLSVTIAPNTKK